MTASSTLRPLSARRSVRSACRERADAASASAGADLRPRLTAWFFCLWLFLPSLVYIQLGSYQDRLQGPDPVLNLASAVIGPLILTAWLAVSGVMFRRIRLAASYETVVAGLLIVVLAYAVVIAPLSIRPVYSFFFAFFFIYTTVLYVVVWQYAGAELRRALPWFGIGLFAFLFFLIALHGYGQGGSGRAVGGIQPTQFGKTALIAALAVWCSPRWSLRVGAFALAFGLAVLVNSRGAMVGLTLFFLLWALFYPLSTRTLIMVVLGGIFGLAAVLLFAERVFAVFSDLMALDAGARGLEGYMLTNRDYYWRLGLQYISERPFFGYGFQTRSGIGSANPAALSAHSGWLNLALDLGLIGLGLMLACLVTALGGRLRELIMLRRRLADAPQLRAMIDFEATAMAGVLIWLAFWIMDPVYIGLGVTFPLFFLALLLAPHGRRVVIDPSVSAPPSAAERTRGPLAQRSSTMSSGSTPPARRARRPGTGAPAGRHSGQHLG